MKKTHDIKTMHDMETFLDIKTMHYMNTMHDIKILIWRPWDADLFCLSLLWLPPSPVGDLLDSPAGVDPVDLTVSSSIGESEINGS